MKEHSTCLVASTPIADSRAATLPKGHQHWKIFRISAHSKAVRSSALAAVPRILDGVDSSFDSSVRTGPTGVVAGFECDSADGVIALGITLDDEVPR